MTANINGLIGSYPVANPVLKAGYVYSRAQTAGVVAANNFLALYNPVGSGRTITVAGVFVNSIVVGDITPTVDPLRGWIATGISGGTLEAVSTIGKVRSTMPAPVGQIFINNPAATLGAAWFNSPPILAAAKTSSSFIHQIPTAIAGLPLTFLPGEGTVLRTESGDVDQRWNLSIAWNES